MKSKIHVSQHSARRMVKQLHHHTAAQRQSVMECRNTAETLTAAGIAFAVTQRLAEEGGVAAPSDDVRDPVTGEPGTHTPPVCFIEVATEKDIKHNLVLDGPLSGVAVAVSDALDVQEFRTRSGLDTPMFHHMARKEFPLVSWLRRQGASFVGKLNCRTPLALNEGCVFGRDKPASIAVASRACHYSINCSLNGPSSIACSVGHDVVGFKPTSQTFGTFTEQFKLAIPSMTVGITASRVDDLLYLWQMYTAAILPDAYLRDGRERGGEGSEGGKRGHETDEAKAASARPSVGSSSAVTGGEKGKQAGERDETYYEVSDPKYARPEILDHNPYNYTVKDRRGRMADIDVGWRDYNAESSEAEDFGKTPRPGFFRRLVYGDKQQYMSPRVELAVGYPAEWIDAYCQRMYGTSQEFHKRLTDSVYYRSALHKNQKLEIIPLAFDFEIDDVIRACNIISHFELARAFERLFYNGAAPEEEEAEAHTRRETPLIRVRGAGNKATPVTLDLKAPAAPNRPNTFKALAGVLEELPKEIVESIDKGQRLTEKDYNSALRVRDDVVRATEEQFQDVDAFVVPLLAEPYVTGDMRSIALTLPFHLAGNPILSVQMDKDLPVALVGELGRDAALLEDSFCFLQFVRGASPKWWRQKVFGDV